MSTKNRLKGVVLAHTDEFNDHLGFRRWVEHAGGRYAGAKITPDVTHLICKERGFKKNISLVSQAKRRYKIKIVSFDWLEDTLTKKSGGRKPETEYLWDKALREKRKADAAKRKEHRKEQKLKQGVTEFEAGVRAFQNEMHSDGYHLYTDSTGYSYNVTLCRPDIVKNRTEYYHLKVRGNPCVADPDLQHLLPIFLSSHVVILHEAVRNPAIRVPLVNPLLQAAQIYESDSVPRRYCAYIKFSRIGKTGTNVLAPVGSDFELAFASFRKFFKSRTGKDWEDRLDGLKPSPKVGPDGEDQWFRYEVPAGKAPKGVTPKDFIEKPPVNRQGTTKLTWAQVVADAKPAALNPIPEWHDDPMDTESGGVSLLDIADTEMVSAPSLIPSAAPSVSGSSSGSSGSNEETKDSVSSASTTISVGDASRQCPNFPSAGILASPTRSPKSPAPFSAASGSILSIKPSVTAVSIPAELVGSHKGSATSSSSRPPTLSKTAPKFSNATKITKPKAASKHLRRPDLPDLPDLRIKQKYPSPIHKQHHQYEPKDGRLPGPGYRILPEKPPALAIPKPDRATTPGAAGQPEVIDLTNDDEVDAIVDELVSRAAATRGVQDQGMEW